MLTHATVRESDSTKCSVNIRLNRKTAPSIRTCRDAYTLESIQGPFSKSDCSGTFHTHLMAVFMQKIPVQNTDIQYCISFSKKKNLSCSQRIYIIVDDTNNLHNFSIGMYQYFKHQTCSS